MKPLWNALACLIVLVFIVGVVLPPVSADWKTTTKPSVAEWTDLVSNVTGAYAWTNTSVSAISGNASVVMANGTATPYYNLTASWTQVIGTQSLNFTTPSAGNYLVTASVNENMTLSSVTAGTYSQFALCDANGTTIVANSERMGTMLAGLDNITSIGRSYTWIYSNSTGSTEVGLCGRVSATPAGRWAVVSDSTGRSTISYVRLP